MTLISVIGPLKKLGSQAGDFVTLMVDMKHMVAVVEHDDFTMAP